MNAHAGMPFCGMFQFAVPTIQSVFDRMVRGQQPFGGVGRLRLSFRGSLEPRSDKCNDLRPFFCFLKKVTVPSLAGEKLHRCLHGGCYG